MKEICRFLVFICMAYWLCACTAISIDFNDPQEVETIQEALQQNDDLVELFGEDNIYFGPNPPSLNDICFRVNGMFYDTCIRYIFDINNGNQIIQSHATTAPYDASVNTHLFYDHVQCIAKHKIKTRDSHSNTYLLDLDNAYIIGHDTLFTTYYVGKIEGNGDPTVAMLISGTLVFDTIKTSTPPTIEFKGVRNYIFGKKILKYDYQPTQAPAPGTIEIKKHPGLSPSCEWDDK